MKKLILPGLFVLSVFTSCTNHFKYFGNSYPPTQDAKIYFREADIDKPYEIMGRMYANFKTNTKDATVQRKIMDAVKKHGGDGAIFGDMNTRSVGSVSSSSGGATRVGKNKNASVGTGVSSSKSIEENDIEIAVIKYKQQ